MTAPALAIGVENPDRPDIRALLEEADRFYASLYPAESNYLLDVASLQAPGVAFFAARENGALLGYGAVALRGKDEAGEDWAEVKRMYVAPAARGRGLGRLILDRLIAHAVAHGVAVLRLESGSKQPESHALYASAGFLRRGPFAGYPDDPLSVYMEMRIA